MKEKEFNNWKESRKKGRKKYILMNGVLSYGLTMFVVMTFFVNKPPEAGLTVLSILTQLFIWSLAGLFFGILMWHFQEKRYHKALENNDNT